MRLNALTVAAAVLLLGQAAGAATLDRLRETGELRVGYRQDAAPFSYQDAVGEPAGYSVELCRAVAAGLKDQLELDAITLSYVPVTAEDRFEAVAGGRIDLLCGAATITLSRRETVDFSIPTFVDGASVLFRSDGPETFEDLAGHKVGVRAATTTEEALRNTLQDVGLDVEVVTLTTHDDALTQLQDNAIQAYFADRAILTFLMVRSGNAGGLRLSDRYFTIEPHALALPRGDADFRLEVDRALSRIYRSGEIAQIFATAFGADARPSELLSALYVISAPLE